MTSLLTYDRSSEPGAGDVPGAPERRRILYVWDADYPWDVRVQKICRALTDAGHDVHIVARNRARRVEREVLPEGTVHRMPAWEWSGRLDGALGFPAFFNPRWASLIDGAIRDLRPDVVIARDLPLCPTAIWAARRHGVPVIHDMAEHYPAMIREIYEVGRQRPLDYLVRNPAVVAAVERWCIARCDRILVVIEEMAERLMAMGVPADRLDLVSNTPPRSRVTPRVSHTREPGEPLRLAYLGIMEIPRGIGDLIEAAAILRDSGQAVQVDLVGTGRDIAEFEARARELGVHGREVRFHGFVASHDAALQIVTEADIGVLPHRRCVHWDHTIPNKLFDYMAAGLPVLTSDARPFARVVQEEQCGEVFSSHDPAAVAAAVRRLADVNRRRREGANGQRAVAERFNWETDTAALLASVEHAVRRARVSPR